MRQNTSLSRTHLNTPKYNMSDEIDVASLVVVLKSLLKARIKTSLTFLPPIPSNCHQNL